MTDSEMLEAIRALLPDTYSESKDWRHGNVIERIIWLKAGLEDKTEEVDRLIDILNDNRISAQAAEIERLRGELARAVGALGCWTRMMNDPAYDMGEMVSEFDAIARTTLAEIKGESHV